MKYRSHLGGAILAIAVTLGATPVAGQCDRPAPSAVDAGSDRPRVGLVLGGGGARGIAHVGVLRVLEELRVPVDLVVGTSMGAIVGSLYAAGLSPDSMYRWLGSADWAYLFRDRPSYSRLSFRRKEEAREFPVPFEVGLGDQGIQLPTGLIAGQKLNAELRSLTFPVARIADFDSLAVPFRAVATDLETGRPVVLGDGDLVDAVRASFSVPGVFTPYSLDGRLLVDGGLVQNVPVQVACELGADVIIAVDVGARLAEREELRSVVDLTMQVTRIMTRSGTKEQVAALGPDDVLIEPELGDMGSMQFDRWDHAVAAGEAAARALTPALSRLAVSDRAFREDRRRRLAFGDPTDRIDFVMVGAYSGRSPGSLIDRIATRPGPLDTAALNADIQHLYSLGIYERVDYRIVETDEGNALILRVREKPWGPSYLRFRLAISDRLGGEGSYSVAGHVLVPQINDWGAEIIADLEIGERRTAGVEFYQPLGVRGTFFLAPWARYQSVPGDVFVGDLSVARFRNHSGILGLETGLHIGNDMEVAVSLERGWLEATRAIGDPSLEGFSADLGMARARFYLDGLDDPLFPQNGIALYSELAVSREWLGASDDYRLVNGQLLGAVSLGPWTFFGAAMGATSFRSSLPGYSRVGLGGFLLMSGYRPGEITGNHLLFGRGMVFREFGDDRAYAGISLEAGNAWPTPGAVHLTDLRHSVAAALGVRTPLGPVYLGIGTRGTADPILYLEVGRSL
jgi:NTE family protein